LACSIVGKIKHYSLVNNFQLSQKEAVFLVALLEGNKQMALQLLAADHFYQPSLLPRLRKLTQAMKSQKPVEE
jgi:hypothetical protein